MSALTISYKAPLYDAGIPSPNGSRRPFSDEPKASPGDIRTFAELIFDFRGWSITESVERLQMGSPRRSAHSRQAEARPSRSIRWTWLSFRSDTLQVLCLEATLRRMPCRSRDRAF